MGILRWGGKVFTSIINIRVDHWIGAGYLKQSVGQTFNSAKSIFVPEQKAREETFEESMQRLNLSNEELKAKESTFTRLFAFHLFLSLLLFCYSIILFYTGNWSGGFMALCLVLYPLALAFRFHFWLFQIKNRKLGCTLKEWWDNK